MCGRYSLTSSVEDISKKFNADFEQKFLINYNSAPSQNLPVITNEDIHKIQLLKWGLIPHWAKEASIGYKMINARVETIAEKPSFKNALKRQRCIVIADGYYEWKKEANKKIPFRITLKDQSLFAFAGIWESWHNEENEQIKSFSIITTEANDYLTEIHNRMPIILSDDQIKKWLDTKINQEEIMSLLLPLSSEHFNAYQVSIKVNSPTNNFPEIIQAV